MRENVTFSLPIIDAHVGLTNYRSAICLGKVSTSRRYLMTLQRHWPEVAKMRVTVSSFEALVQSRHADPGIASAYSCRAGQNQALRGKRLDRRVAGLMR